jgi:hypothetical protein
VYQGSCEGGRAGELRAGREWEKTDDARHSAAESRYEERMLRIDASLCLCLRSRV